MKRYWKVVAKLAFRGRRVVDAALDLSELQELGRFQSLATETARAVFLGANRNRVRVPKGFEEETRLFLRRIKPGSAVAPLEIRATAHTAALFRGDPGTVSYIERAVDVAWQTFDAIERDKPVPPEISHDVLKLYEDFGSSLVDGEEIRFQRRKGQSTPISPRTRERFARLQPSEYEDSFEQIGEVLEADVRQRRFQLWLDTSKKLVLPFSPEQEQMVVEALKQHQTVRLKVTGRGRFAGRGDLRQIDTVRDLDFSFARSPLSDTPSMVFSDAIDALVNGVPESEWQNIPSDLSARLDEYLTAPPKK